MAGFGGAIKNISIGIGSAEGKCLNQAEGREALVSRMEGRNAELVLEHGEEIGLGSRSYQLRRIDG